jgi:hypothetical protein
VALGQALFELAGQADLGQFGHYVSLLNRVPADCSASRARAQCMRTAERMTTLNALMADCSASAYIFIANLFSDPEKRLDEDLRNFKAYVEGTHSRTATA